MADSKLIPLVVRFWSKVDRRDPNDCWFWIGAIGIHGYGVIGRGTREDGVILAHRASWEIHNGPIPEGSHVLHTCDDRYPAGDHTNRKCVNPAHLKTGSNKENVADMLLHKRQQRGERYGAVKLDTAAILEIRASDEPARFFANKFDVSFSAIHLIRRRKRWAHVGEPTQDSGCE